MARRRRSAARGPGGRSKLQGDAPAAESRFAPAPIGRYGVSNDHILGLQQAIGNHAVHRLLVQRQQAEPGTTLQRATGGHDYDPFGQQGREEDEERQTELDNAYAMLGPFEEQAKLNVVGLLNGSEEIVQAERKRYGIPLAAVLAPSMASPDFMSQVAEGGENEDLANAAAAIAEVSDPLLDLYDELMVLEGVDDQGQQYDVEGSSFFEGESDFPASASSVSVDDDRSLDDLLKRIEEAEKEYAVIRDQMVREFPVLAMYAPSEFGSGHAGLQELAAGPSPEVLAMLAVDMAEKLRNIATTRKAVGEGDLPIWSLPKIMDMTKSQFGIADGSIEDQVIKQRVAQFQRDETLFNTAMAALGLALGIAAIVMAPTAPLAAGAFTLLSSGVNGVMTYEHLQDYMIKSAAAGTDFDMARSIAMEEPSFFWMAIEIVMLIGDVYVAQAVFRELLPFARAAVKPAAAAGRSADDALVALREEGNFQMQGLGDKLEEGAKSAAGRAAKAAGDNVDEVVIAWGRRGARLPALDKKKKAQAVGDFWPEGGHKPIRYGPYRSGKESTRPGSDLSKPGGRDRHILEPPAGTPEEQYKGIPKGLTPEAKQKWLNENRAAGSHPGSRAHDAEVKAFEDLLKDTSKATKGEFHFKVDRPSCPACKDMIFRFAQERPGIKVIQH